MVETDNGKEGKNPGREEEGLKRGRGWEKW